MRTEAWIALCAVFAVAAFFAGTLYGEATMRPMVDSQVDQVRELEMVVHSMERREVMLVEALGGKLPPGLPEKHVQAGGKVIRQ
jgi:hypothetical protein